MKFKKVNRGLVHVYTGEGKGKTSAALGLALRAISYRRQVLIVQFIKGPWASGELNVAKRLKPYLKIKSIGRGFVGILGDKLSRSEHKKAAQKAFNFAGRVMRTGKFSVIILDEINVAMQERLVAVKQVVDFIKKKPSNVELVLTGRGAPIAVKHLADYVSEIKEIKHPFQKGILARPSIDY